MFARGLCARCYRRQYKRRCAGRRSPEAIEAQRLRAKEYVKALSPQEKKKLYRRQTLIRYGLTEEAFEKILREQGGLCGVCRKPMEKPVIDHDHTTGKARGVLHNLCNVLVGYVEGFDVGLATAYLKRVKE